MKKIVYFASDYPPTRGGISTYVVEWLKVASEIFTTQTYIFGNKNPRIENNVTIFATKNFFIMGIKVLFLIIREKSEVFHAFYIFPIGFWVVFWSFILGKKSIVTIHGTDIGSREGKWFTRKMKYWTLSHASKVIAVSESTKRIYNNSTVIYINAPSLKVHIKEKKDFIVLSTSRLVKRKGIEYLIQAVNSLSVPIKLYIASDGPERKELEKIAGDKVTFLGMVDDLAPLYECASVVALTSYVRPEGDYEGLGLVLLEAQSFGLPVIGSNSGGIPEAFEPNVTGILVPEKDSQAIAQAILRLYQDKELYKKMSQETGPFLERKFGKEKMKKEYTDLIDSL